MHACILVLIQGRLLSSVRLAAWIFQADCHAPAQSSRDSSKHCTAHTLFFPRNRTCVSAWGFACWSPPAVPSPVYGTCQRGSIQLAVRDVHRRALLLSVSPSVCCCEFLPFLRTRLLQLMLDFALMEIPGSPASPWPRASFRTSSAFQAGRTVFYDFLYAQTRILFLFCYLLKNAPNPPFSLSSASCASVQAPLSSSSRLSSAPPDDASGAAVSALANFLARGAAPALPTLILRLLRLLSPPFLFKRKTVHESLKLLVSSPRFRWLVAPYLQDILTNELAAATGSTDAPMLRAYAFSNIHELLVAFASDLQAWDTSFLSALLRAVGGAFNCDFSRAFGTGAVGEGITTPSLVTSGDQSNADSTGTPRLLRGGIRRPGGTRGGGGGATGPGGEKVSIATLLHTRQLLVKIVSYVVEVGVKKAHQAGAAQGAKAAAAAVAEAYEGGRCNEGESRGGPQGEDISSGSAPPPSPSQNHAAVAGDGQDEPARGAELSAQERQFLGEFDVKAESEAKTSGVTREGNGSSVTDVSPAALMASWRDVRGGVYGAKVDEALDDVRSLLRQAVEILGLSLKTLRAMIPEVREQTMAFDSNRSLEVGVSVGEPKMPGVCLDSELRLPKNPFRPSLLLDALGRIEGLGSLRSA